MSPDSAILILNATSTTAAIFSTLLFLPQMFKSLITRGTADTSLFLFAITIAADVFWLLYGVTLFLSSTNSSGINLGGINLIWQNGAVFIIAIVLFVIKLYNLRRAKSQGLTEATYCEQANTKRKAKRQNPNSTWSKFVDILAGEYKIKK